MQRIARKVRSIPKELIYRMPFFSRKKTDVSQLAASVSAVKIGGLVIPVEVVSTKAAIDKGLSEREELGASDGMLFLFDHTARFRFWMRKMLFPLDLVWIGENMQIIDITRNVPPLSDEAEALFYSPIVPAMYVLEVNANFCDAHHIQLGETVELVTQ